MSPTNKLFAVVISAASTLVSADINPSAARRPLPYVTSISRGGSADVQLATGSSSTPEATVATATIAAAADTQPETDDAPQKIVDSTLPRGGSEVCPPVQSPNTPKKIALSTKAAVLSGCALAFNSGYVNGACLSGILSPENTKQAAAAVTGAWTNSALGVASGNYDQALFNAKCIGSYMIGSVIASLCNPFPVPFEISTDKISPAFLLGSILLYASSSIASKSGGADKSFIFLSAIACGIQNSVTSVLTSNLVRSAHFSGITSDIGTFLGQVLRGNKQNAMKLKVFSGLAASFWVGGLVSFSATNAYASSSLLFSSALFLAIAIGLVVA